ncbi:hypothetical protein Y1Q_0021088 [Alligator mississippiensis]|uniref:Reverse transcriptase domain-containing protein n=1 Tax=Alligator mississippiensis TaxID=8496 RepID=A0A151NRM0_ALLMI|nr:hypothetical protein Y1Q_0021088 [Alligator mississippiensis]
MQVLWEDKGQKLVEEWMLQETNTMLCSFQNGKNPGVSSLSMEFYVAFWDQVELDLLEVYRQHLQEGHLGTRIEEGLITFLYKKGERQDLRNWHPITLLNLDYKLMAKVLIKCFKSVIGIVIRRTRSVGCRGNRSMKP